jgi:hypothetical protein
MSLEPKKLGEFGMKQYTWDLYTWTPDRSIKKTNLQSPKVKNSFCNATAGSQGEDWITTYVYTSTINKFNGLVVHSAYVECGYVE